MATYEVPLTAASQTFRISLAGVTYQLTVIWRDAANAGWVLDIADDNGAAIVQGIPLVTGADLLEQYAYLNFGGQLQVQTDHDVDAVPLFDNLGSSSHLYFIAA